MADKKTEQKLEREYIIPLRRAWVNVPAYKRARKAVMAMKIFVAKHMKVADRDLDKVKLDPYLNNELWFRGKTNPPSRIKVRVTKDGDIVKVNFAEIPQYVKFLKLKHLKVHKKEEKKKEEVKEVKEEKQVEEKTEEQRVDEKEKGKAVEQQNIKQADQELKAQKHTTKVKEERIQRMALKK